MFVNGKYFYGNEISEYGQKHGYVDYRTLAKAFDAVLNNDIIQKTYEIGEIVFYNEELDMYVWGVTHWGTSWDYVLTDIKCNVPFDWEE